MDNNGKEIAMEIERVFDVEIQELEKTKKLVCEQMKEVVYTIEQCQGKVFLSGMGKPGHIAKKIVATMSSLGTPANFLHPAEAAHGDLGGLSKGDVLIVISNSGTTRELYEIIPNAKKIGAILIVMTSNPEAFICSYADIKVILPQIKEADEMKIAPTSSTTIALVIGDALAVTLAKRKKFTKEEFALYHPGGALGNKLQMKVKDLMFKGERSACILAGKLLAEGIREMTEKSVGGVCVINTEGKLLGIITDGDLRRAMQEAVNIYEVKVEEIMNKKPIVVSPELLVIDALRMMEGKKKLTVLPVVDDNNLVMGIIRNHEMLEL